MEVSPTASIQRWMEEDIIARGICPPLVKLASGFREDGKINWLRMSEEVVIEDATHSEPESEELLLHVAGSYIDLLKLYGLGKGPLVYNTVFADFGSNQAFSRFLGEVKALALDHFISTRTGRNFVTKAFLNITRAQDRPDSVKKNILEQGPSAIAFQVIEGACNTIDFYGRRVSEGDFEDFGTERGPAERYKMLARSPYYLMQVINPIRSISLIGHLNREMVHERNTVMALTTNFDDYEETMADFRGSSPALPPADMSPDPLMRVV